VAEVHSEGARFLVLAEPGGAVEATSADERNAPSGEADPDQARVVFGSIMVGQLRALRSSVAVMPDSPDDVRAPRSFTIAVDTPVARAAPARLAIAGEDARVAMEVVTLRGAHHAWPRCASGMAFVTRCARRAVTVHTDGAWHVIDALVEGAGIPITLAAPCERDRLTDLVPHIIAQVIRFTRNQNVDDPAQRGAGRNWIDHAVGVDTAQHAHTAASGVRS